MKVTDKRQRSDSIAAAVTASQNAAKGPLAPPSHIALRMCDREFWDAIVSARARDTWNDSDLSIAATLARAQSDVERLHFEIDSEGEITRAANGCPIINPKCKLLEMLTKRIVSLARVLHVHAEATVGKSEDSAKGLANERAARDTEHDDLIPTLRAVG